ncbi:MAG: 1,4-dihydroxy-2-naphthoate polyprenyltransferase [Phycisphaerae bacterium]|nr:1,4-dihydroxy-2-naphthoate polyprenyltransferase [Phycisphaerae bacterium]
MQLRKWIIAARPKTLWAAVVPVTIGLVLTKSNGNLHILSAIVTLLSAIFIQIGTNYTNDFCDFIKGSDRGDRKGPTRITASGGASPKQVAIAAIGTFGLACICGLYLIYRGGWPILAIGLASIIAGILYTAGPKPLGYIGLGDIFVLIFFGPVAVAGTYWVQCLEFSYESIIIGLGAGLISVAILVVNNLRDVEQDRISHKGTLVVKLGTIFGKIEYVACISGGFMVPAIYALVTGTHKEALFMPLAAVVALPVIRVVLKDGANGEKMNKALADTGKLLVWFGGVFAVLWLW